MKWINELPRWLLGGLALPLLVLNGWVLLQVIEYFRQLLTIFIGASLLAFILDYAVRWLERQGLSRSRAIFLVFLLALSVFFVLGVTLIPVLLRQVNELFDRLPVWIESGNLQLRQFQAWAIARRLPVDPITFITQVQESLIAQLQPLSGGVVGLGIGLAGITVDLGIMTVLTFYLLVHGENLWDGIFRWLPVGMGYRLQRSLRQNFHNYFSGQAILAAMMGSAMILAFLVLNVPFGLLFGLVVGITTLIPLGAPLSILFVSFVVGLGNFWLGMKMLIVGILLDQIIENAIAPRLLGRFTGLNPIWVIVALLLGVRVGGLLGLLMAVPTAGFIKATTDALHAERDNFAEK